MKGSVFPYPFRVEDGRRVPARPPKQTTWTYAFAYQDPATGKRRQVTKRGHRTKAEAQAALTEALAQHQRGDRIEPSRMTVADWLRDEWLPAQELRLKPSTFAGYRSIVDGRLIPHLGAVRLADLTAGHIAAMVTALRATGNRRGKSAGTTGLSERSLSHTHKVLGKALEDAARRRLIARNPAHDVDRPKPRNAEMRTWSADELRAFLAATAGDRWHTLWVMAATTGMRRGELLGLRWDDVDLDAGQVSVRRALVAAGYDVHEGEPKSGRARTVAVDPDTVAELRRWRRVQLEERMAAGTAWVDSGRVFTVEDGRQVHPQTAGWHFTKAVRGAGVPAIRFHDIRHTHATLALQAGVHPKVVQERLGHSSISITLDLYSHVAPGMQEEAAAKIAAAIFGGGR